MSDFLPIVSQLKSLTQAICGDLEGARQTQIDFSRKCPIVSQVRSAIEAIQGDQNAARETQLECLKNLSNIMNAVPGVGHLKGAIHYAAGDKIGGDQAMKSASRTIGIVYYFYISYKKAFEKILIFKELLVEESVAD